MSTHNICFYEDLTKISLNYHQISSNTHLISSAELWVSYNPRSALVATRVIKLSEKPTTKE